LLSLRVEAAPVKFSLSIRFTCL